MPLTTRIFTDNRSGAEEKRLNVAPSGVSTIGAGSPPPPPLPTILISAQLVNVCSTPHHVRSRKRISESTAKVPRDFDTFIQVKVIQEHTWGPRGPVSLSSQPSGQGLYLKFCPRLPNSFWRLEYLGPHRASSQGMLQCCAVYQLQLTTQCSHVRPSGSFH